MLNLFSFHQTIQYITRSKIIETETRELSSVSRGKIKCAETDDWKNEKLFVPPLPPTNLRGCHIIRIQYDVFVSKLPLFGCVQLRKEKLSSSSSRCSSPTTVTEKSGRVMEWAGQAAGNYNLGLRRDMRTFFAAARSVLPEIGLGNYYFYIGARGVGGRRRGGALGVENVERVNKMTQLLVGVIVHSI
jgi:hypothetical protein